MAVGPQTRQPCPETLELFLRSCDLTAWMCFTSLGIPNCGSTATSKGTWSGMISRARTSARYLKAALGIKLKGRSATLSTSTLRRYFGHQTTWYLQLYTTLLFDLYPSILRAL